MSAARDSPPLAASNSRPHVTAPPHPQLGAPANGLQTAPMRARGGQTPCCRWYGHVANPANRIALEALSNLNYAQAANGRSTAAVLAELLLTGVGTRLAHTAMVANQVDQVADLVDGGWGEAVRDAGWLHDVGYSERVVRTGFHPLDAARWLRDRDWPIATCRLVAWHTGASVESRLLGLDRELAAEFDRPPAWPAAVLTWADLTSSPGGELCSVSHRLADMLRRYPSDSVVHQSIMEATPMLLGAASEVEARLALQTEDA